MLWGNGDRAVQSGNAYGMFSGAALPRRWDRGCRHFMKTDNGWSAAATAVDAVHGAWDMLPPSDPMIRAEGPW